MIRSPKIWWTVALAWSSASCQWVGDIHYRALEEENESTDASIFDARNDRMEASAGGREGDASSGDAMPTSDADARASDGPGGTDGPPDSGLTDAGGGVNQCHDLCEQAGIGNCIAGTCVIDCPTKDSCPQTVFCPVGVPCTVRCGLQGCPKGVDCNGPNCHIQCSGDVSCAGMVHCSGGKCVVECSQSAACLSGVQCSSTECHLSCGGASSCGGRVACLDTTKTCNITCGGQYACANTVEGSHADAVIDCTGQQSCSGQVSCSGTTCSVFCGTSACNGGVCCGSQTCDLHGTRNQCAVF